MDKEVRKVTFFQKAGKLSYRKQSIGKFIAKLKNAHFPHFKSSGQKKYPARLAEPCGVGLVFISTNILLRGLYLYFQLKGLEI